MFQDIQFDTSDSNIYMNVYNIQIKPNIMAIVDYGLMYRTGGGVRKSIEISGDDYRKWSVDDRYLFIYLCNLHNVSYVERVEPEYIERNYCLPNEDGTFRNIVELKKNPKYTGLPPLVVTQDPITNTTQSGSG